MFHKVILQHFIEVARDKCIAYIRPKLVKKQQKRQRPISTTTNRYWKNRGRYVVKIIKFTKKALEEKMKLRYGYGNL